MGRLRQFFEGAETTDASVRRVGLEVETLFIDASGEPLDEAQGRGVFAALRESGWRPDGDGPSARWDLRREGFLITPEVGAGNIEMITPPRQVRAVDRLVDETADRLEALYEAAKAERARPIFGAYDGAQHVDNILLPDERDHKWAQVDGRPALKHLGHIASVHVTLDVASLEEAFDWTAAVNDLARDRGWPAAETERVWSDYLTASRVDYDPGRAGPAPESFDAYIEKLQSFHVVMDRTESGELRRLGPDPPRLADIEATVDLPTFLRTVWLQTRLRVIEGRLALEVRVVPRRSDEALARDVRELLDTLGVAVD